MTEAGATGGTVQLRLVGPEDRDRLRAWRNDPAVAQHMYTTHEIGPEEHARWFAGLLGDDRRRAWVASLDGVPVGAVFVTGIDRENRRATWGFYVADPRTRGRGVGSAIWVFVLDHVFEELGLHKLCSEVLSSNEASLAMHQKFGFRTEGVLHDHVLRDGRWLHAHLLAMWADDWAERRAGFEAGLRGNGRLA
ncbi:UDP-4-amino-4,6-dideoxy-N-acetyl-beta-L-altrosamine N-acetyltransferase [Blastococcus saxobsidens]|uniref:UDP-4-amino-4, 6-dideoxy-N-acetyl-beta-L-altrosamine N-acetyltransferase n=1 Tax=Blastococcus saxobsidens TaxID=138336 RepID=A0A4Q7Y945_9ACTN|nr:UDP-4-amino-4,6-dideoxy-N-acetyl-beta-L-altrosamine N-acetyltransferase [Blastococcus saxobsidens]RZU33044.1 UDP-4-amino-4,6-dideoxy-N-acetyl-beta-L-altrosamine N-acetyltransferase [Blastococcus saxobsidens]